MEEAREEIADNEQKAYKKNEKEKARKSAKAVPVSRDIELPGNN